MINDSKLIYIYNGKTHTAKYKTFRCLAGHPLLAKSDKKRSCLKRSEFFSFSDRVHPGVAKHRQLKDLAVNV